MSGRWTLTTTSRPSRSAAACAWPRLAVASGSWSNDENSLLMRPPSCSCDRVFDVGEGDRADVVLQSLKLLDVVLGNEVRASGEHLPELHVRRTELHQPLAKRDGAVGGAVAVGRLSSLFGSEVDQPLLARKVAQAVAREQPDRCRESRHEAWRQKHTAEQGTNQANF